MHRSQQDPLIADETAPQHVLVESKQQLQSILKKNEVILMINKNLEQIREMTY